MKRNRRRKDTEGWNGDGREEGEMKKRRGRGSEKTEGKREGREEGREMMAREAEKIV